MTKALSTHIGSWALSLALTSRERVLQHFDLSGPAEDFKASVEDFEASVEDFDCCARFEA